MVADAGGIRAQPCRAHRHVPVQARGQLAQLVEQFLLRAGNRGRSAHPPARRRRKCRAQKEYARTKDAEEIVGLARVLLLVLNYGNIDLSIDVARPSKWMLRKAPGHRPNSANLLQWQNTGAACSGNRFCSRVGLWYRVIDGVPRKARKLSLQATSPRSIPPRTPFSDGILNDICRHSPAWQGLQLCAGVGAAVAGEPTLQFSAAGVALSRALLLADDVVFSRCARAEGVGDLSDDRWRRRWRGGSMTVDVASAEPIAPLFGAHRHGAASRAQPYWHRTATKRWSRTPCRQQGKPCTPRAGTGRAKLKSLRAPGLLQVLELPHSGGRPKREGL